MYDSSVTPGDHRRKVLTPGRALPLYSLLLLAALRCAAATDRPGSDAPSLEAIRREAVVSPSGPDGLRLPLAASWAIGAEATGFSPDWQVEALEQGQYILPWFGLSVPRPPAGANSNYPWITDAPYYYARAVRYLAQHHLPLSFDTTQWEVLLSEVSADYAQRGPDGKLPPISPFGPIEPWYATGRAWARHPTLRRLEQLYPDPPLVLFVSNNEHPKLSPDDLNAAYRADAGPELIARRRAIGDAWIERYRALERGFREGLEAPGWRAHAVFVGYDALVTPAMGRWSGWPAYSLYVPGRTEPWPFAWDGASESYYLHDWASDGDFMVWSPQIEAMNFIPVLAEVRTREPAFWFEISVWDGQRPGEPTDKAHFYALRDQQFTPLRYGGLTQFGMWLLRPRVVRAFFAADDRVRFGDYFDAILAAVARVHQDPTLCSFWHRGQLLENPVGGHPYEAALPAELASRPRWFLLDSPQNPPRPWELTTMLPVYALALELGHRPAREWLVYAFAPLAAATEVEVTIPGGPQVRVPASLAGAFAVISERDGSVRPVGPSQPSQAGSASGRALPAVRACVRASASHS